MNKGFDMRFSVVLIDKGFRPNAKQVLVIVIDKKSDSTADDVRNAAAQLGNNNIGVISVALGSEADVEELTNGTLDVIKADNKDETEKIADEIIRKASKCAL